MEGVRERKISNDRRYYPSSNILRENACGAMAGLKAIPPTHSTIGKCYTKNGSHPL